MKKMFLAIGLAALVSSLSAQKDDIIILEKCKSPPVIDGMLDDACWKNRETFKSFSIYEPANKQNQASDDTEIKLTYDNQWLYFAAKCKHPEPQNMKADDNRSYSYRVHRDENIEIILSPDIKSKQLYRFNVTPIGTMMVRDSMGKDTKWNYGTFCRAETVITKDGWQAEGAIPLAMFYSQESAQKGLAGINLARQMYLRVIDTYGVFTCYDVVGSALLHDGPNIESGKSLARLNYSPMPQMEMPFTVNIQSVQLNNYRIDAEKVFYDIELWLNGYSKQSGDVEIFVDDSLNPEFARKPVLTVLQGQPLKKYRISIPANSFGIRKIQIVLKNKQGTILDRQTINAIEKLIPFEGRFNRNYYTDEENARLVYNSGIPQQILNKMSMTITDENKTVLAESNKLTNSGVITLPVNKLRLGNNPVTVSLLDGKKILYSINYTLVKKTPQPGKECKIDSETRTMLVNGKPFFPFGFHVVSYDKKDFEIFAQNGVNAITPFFTPTTLSEQLEFTKDAQKYGIKVITNIDFLGRPTRLPSMEKFFSGTELETARMLTEKRKHFDGNVLKCLLVESMLGKLSYHQKSILFEEYYQTTIENNTKYIKAFNECDNVIGHCTYDEPLLGYFDMHAQGLKLYNLFNAIDGYRPVFVIYPCYFPTTPDCADWLDALGVDPYWAPPCNPGDFIRNNINHVSKFTGNAKTYADKYNKLCWVTLLTEYSCGSFTRVLAPQEFRCQSYLALINGAKGIIYFVYPIRTLSVMQAFKELSVEIQKMLPFLSSTEIKQNITYTTNETGCFYPAVQVNIKRNQQNDFIMLAANSRPYPVEFNFEFSKGKLLGAKDFFSGKPVSVENGILKEKLAPFGTKVYALKWIVSMPIEATVKAVADKTNFSPEAVCPRSGRPGKKNILPNPSFETATVKGWPDYYYTGNTRPFPAVGEKSSPWAQDLSQAYHGKASLRISQGKDISALNYCLFRLAPQVETPTQYTFSAYIKADRNNVPVWFASNFDENIKKVNVTNEWKRYTYTVTVPRNLNMFALYTINLKAPDSTIWIDALQLEPGNEATPFTVD